MARAKGAARALELEQPRNLEDVITCTFDGDGIMLEESVTQLLVRSAMNLTFYGTNLGNSILYGTLLGLGFQAGDEPLGRLRAFATEFASRSLDRGEPREVRPSRRRTVPSKSVYEARGVLAWPPPPVARPVHAVHVAGGGARPARGGPFEGEKDLRIMMNAIEDYRSDPSAYIDIVTEEGVEIHFSPREDEVAKAGPVARMNAAGEVSWLKRVKKVDWIRDPVECYDSHAVPPPHCRATAVP